MKFHWENAEYRIRQQANGNIISAWVKGTVSKGFGIHEVESGWNITHLKTGWSAFSCPTEEGARIIAAHLIENYRLEFEKLIIFGTRVSNYFPLEEKIKADVELTELRRLYAYSTQQLRAIGAGAKQKIEIVS